MVCECAADWPALCYLWNRCGGVCFKNPRIAQRNGHPMRNERCWWSPSVRRSSHSARDFPATRGSR